MTSKRLLWWLLAGTSGGFNRARIILSLHEMPSNANQLAEQLDLDYKTIRHHLDVLMKHEVVVSEGEAYGILYFVSDDIESCFDDFCEIWERIGKKGLKDSKKGRDE